MLWFTRVTYDFVGVLDLALVLVPDTVLADVADAEGVIDVPD
jgi:hypothetical protein